MTIPLLSFAPPRAEMHFVNADRAARPIFRAGAPPSTRRRSICNARDRKPASGRFSVLIEKGERIALEKSAPVCVRISNL